MTLAAVALVKDELDILPATLSHLLTQVDFVIVQDNASSDGTRDYLADLARDDERVTVIDDPDPAYYQAEKVTALALMAAERGADWVLPVDSDEWHYSPFGRIADVLAEFPGAVATVEIYDHRATGADPDEPNPVKRMGWRARDPLPLHKIACRPLLPVTITQGNHGADYPLIQPLHGQVVLRHFPYRSVEQLIRKARNGAAAYAATTMDESVGKHWRDYGRLSDEQLAEVFHTWFYSAEPASDDTLIFDPAP